MTQLHETVLTFKIVGQGSGRVWIDTAQSMSMVNRKLERQQGLWQILGVQLFADVTEGLERVGLPYTVSMSGAPRTWVTRNSLVKAFHAWRDQQQLAFSSIGNDSIRPRWQDFKVWLNDEHRTGLTITPTSGHMFGNDDAYAVGEWVHSKLVYEEVDGAGAVVEQDPELHILNSDNMPQAVGLIHQYGLSRAIPFSPDPDLPSSVALNIYTQSANALSEQVETITSNMKTDNDEAPYDPEHYPGEFANGHDPILFGFVASGSFGGAKGRKTTMNGFAAPNGLIEIQYDLETSVGQTAPELWIQLVVGERSDY